MLIRFDDLKHKHKIDATGVLHIGASTGQEAEMYNMCGMHKMCFVEAIPSVYERLKQHIASFPQAIAINACVSDTNGTEVNFNISSNDGESSSFLEFGTHAKVHSNVTFVDTIKLKTKRIDTIFTENNLQISDYQFLNIDLQGCELFALKGMGDLLKHFRYAYLEVNIDELYIGCARKHEIDEYLKQFGLIGVEEKITSAGWGDRFYVRVDG